METSWKPGPRERGRLDDRLADRNLVLVIDLLDRAVDHQRDEFGLVGLADLARGHERAVAQHRDPVAKLEHLFETMADVDDRDAAGLELSDQLEQRRRLLAGEIGGRLVEDEELCAAPLGARGRDKLLLADRQRGQDYVGRQGEAELIEQLLRVALHPLLVEKAARAFPRRRERCWRRRSGAGKARPPGERR